MAHRESAGSESRAQREERWQKAVSAEVSASPLAAHAMLADEQVADFGFAIIREVVRTRANIDSPDVLADLLDRVPEQAPKKWFTKISSAARLVRHRAPGFGWHQIAGLFSAGCEDLVVAPQRGIPEDTDIMIVEQAVLGRGMVARRFESWRGLVDEFNPSAITVPVAELLQPVNFWAVQENISDIVDLLTPFIRFIDEESRDGDPADPSDSSAPVRLNFAVENYHQLNVIAGVLATILPKIRRGAFTVGLHLGDRFKFTPQNRGLVRDLAATVARDACCPLLVRVALTEQLFLSSSGSETDTADDDDQIAEDLNDTTITGYGVDWATWLMDVDLGVPIDLTWRIANPADPRQLHLLAGMRESLDALGQQAREPAIEVMHHLWPRLAEELRQDFHEVSYFAPALWESGQSEVILGFYERFLGDTNRVRVHPPRLNSPELPFRTAKPFLTESAKRPTKRYNRYRELAYQLPVSTRGTETATRHLLHTPDDARTLIAAATEAHQQWRQEPVESRLDKLEHFRRIIKAGRNELAEVLSSETGCVVTQAHREVTQALSAVDWILATVRADQSLAGATPQPPAGPALVNTSWTAPVADPIQNLASVLVTGSAAVFMPDIHVVRCAAVVWSMCVTAFGHDQVRLAVLRPGDEKFIGRVVQADSRFSQILYSGTTEAMHSLTQHVHAKNSAHPVIRATGSAKNSMIVTPTADIDQACADIVGSAFARSGQTHHSLSVLILVGSLAESDQFKNQLIDATRSLEVGYPSEPRSHIGRLVSRPSENLIHGLEELGPGESWWLAPRLVDGSGRLCTPGIRAFVRPGSDAHVTEYLGPVLSVLRADTLDEAIELVNTIPYAVAAGLHTGREADAELFRQKVQAPALLINTAASATDYAGPGITAVAGAKASHYGAIGSLGGRHGVRELVDWIDESRVSVDAQPSALSASTAGLSPHVLRILRAGLDAGVAGDWLVSALRQDARILRGWLTPRSEATPGSDRQVTGRRTVSVTRWEEPTNQPVVIRCEGGIGQLLRVIAAGLVIGCLPRVSLASELPEALNTELTEILGEDNLAVHTWDEFLTEVSALAEDENTSEIRVRLITSEDDESSEDATPDPMIQRRADLVTAVTPSQSLVLVTHPVVSASEIEGKLFIRERAAVRDEIAI